MRLSEIITILKDTELKQIVVGEDDSLVLSLLNLALIDIYGRLNILQEEQTISIVEGQTRYTLQDNSQKVLQVFHRNTITNPLDGDDAFEEVTINDINSEDSVFTPSPYVLHIPNPDVGEIYLVIHVVTPPYITPSNIDTIDFIVPPQFLEAITSYAAWRAYKSMNGEMQTEISSLYQTYERAVNDILKRGLSYQSILTNIKSKDRGFA